jgi:hypothetical protein
MNRRDRRAKITCEELPAEGAEDDVISPLKSPKLLQPITDWPRSETDSWTDEESTSMAFFISI